MNEKLYKTIVALWGIILLILQAISLITVVGINPGGYSTITRLFVALIATLMTALTIIFMVLSLKNKKSGPIIGILVGIVYTIGSITSFGVNIVATVFGIVFGIAFVFYCIGLLRGLPVKKVQDQAATETH